MLKFGGFRAEIIKYLPEVGDYFKGMTVAAVDEYPIMQLQHYANDIPPYCNYVYYEIVTTDDDGEEFKYFVAVARPDDEQIS